jgi:hypothetical protein
LRHLHPTDRDTAGLEHDVTYRKYYAMAERPGIEDALLF